MGVCYGIKNIREIHGFMHLTCFYPVCRQIDPAFFIRNLFACRLLGSMVFFKSISEMIPA
jgi:hypothetical protein